MMQAAMRWSAPGRHSLRAPCTISLRPLLPLPCSSRCLARAYDSRACGGSRLLRIAHWFDMVGVALVARVLEGDLTDDVCGVCGSRSALVPRLVVSGSVSLRASGDEGVRTLRDSRHRESVSSGRRVPVLAHDRRHNHNGLRCGTVTVQHSR